jgi:transcriptional regulator with XRE-family HTH domain
MDIGKRISTLRRERGWTQAQLAEKLVITDKAVSKWEQGRGDPELSSIVKLSEVFGVTTDCLLIDKVWESRNVMSVNPRTNRIIRIGKSIEAATHAELLNRLLGKDFDGYMKCTYNIDCFNTVWMIRLDGTVGPTGWANVLIHKDKNIR